MTTYASTTRVDLRAVAIVLLASALPGCFSPATAEREIRAVLADQAESWNRGDIAGFMQHYLKSEELTFSAGGTTQQGWQATLERYQKRYPTPEQMGRLRFELDAFRYFGADAALVLGRWFLTRAAGPLSGNFSLVLEKRAGAWVIVHDHTSSAPP
jgi:uncharacterized protein (TIGR02246 family)